MVEGRLPIGIAVALFVGFNIGSATRAGVWVAVGPNAISKTGTAALTVVSVPIGAWTIGHRVVEPVGASLGFVAPCRVW